MAKLDKAKIDRFWKKRTKIKDARVSTHFRRDDMHEFDLKLIEKYITPSSRVLDLGAGTCFHANRLLDKVAYIKAVDKFGSFLKHCKKSKKLKTEESNILEYTDNKTYDIILLLGVLNYFDDHQALTIYNTCHKLLKKKGVLIVKHQAGIKEDFVVNKYSKQICDTYHAIYRYKKRDIDLLEKLFYVGVIDIYPKRLNPWPNTHFYAFICKKRL